MNNYAYVTLLSSEDYLPAVLILHKNLKQVQSQYPLIVAVTENIFNQVKPYLEQERILYKIIPFLEYTQETKDRWMIKRGTAYSLNIAAKFAIFKFYEFDKLVYIDSDIMIYQNIDNLFNYPDGALYDDDGQPFIGLFVFIPKNHPADYYYTLSLVLHRIESDILEPLFFPFKSNPDYRIPYEYYINVTNNLELTPFNQIKVIHFCYNYKPWRYLNANSFFYDYNKEFPNEHSQSRWRIINDYMDNYLIPLFKKYPEFKQYCKNVNS